MSISLLYFLFVFLPNLAGFFCTISIISGIMGFTAGFIYVVALLGDGMDCKRIRPTAFRWFLFFLIVFFFSELIGVFSPSERQIYMVAGGYAATNSAELKKLPDNVLKTANDYLEHLQNSIEPKKKEEK